MRLFPMRRNIDAPFTIIIPVFNVDDVIARCLSSLVSSVDDIYEVIVVDDGCTDDTIRIVKSFRRLLPIRVIKNTGAKGPGPARQAGLLAAQSAWITFLDSDDSLSPSCLQYVKDKIIDEANENQNPMVVQTMTMVFDSGNFDADNIDYVPNQCCGHFYFRKYLIDNKLGFHPSLFMDEDEYFTNKLYKHMLYCDATNPYVAQYEYPVYIEQHDESVHQSFTDRKWVDYVIKWRLLYRRYIVEDFIHYRHMRDMLLEEFVGSIIFAYFVLCMFVEDANAKVDIAEQKQHIREALQFLIITFDFSVHDLVLAYEQNKNVVNEALEGAKSTMGVDSYTPFQSFGEFILSI